jgi:hypothetical protein
MRPVYKGKLGIVLIISSYFSIHESGCSVVSRYPKEWERQNIAVLFASENVGET